MSITSALMTATTGLGAVARGAETVASNIANAATDGYARREVLTSSQIPSGGVRIDGIARMINTGILAEYRIALAGSGHAARINDFHTVIEGAVGIPGNPTSISDRLAAFEAALVSASSRPDDDIRLADVLTSMTDLTKAINRMGNAAQDARLDAQDAITRDVGRLTSGLAAVARLNKAITVETANGRDVSALEDARQREIDGIAEIIPLREAKRENGQISLFTTGGAALLDGSKPVEIEFLAIPPPQPGMGVGGLSFLVIDGRPLTESQMELYGGGTLAASFEIRDRLAPVFQQQADQFAADLSLIFGDTGPDSSIPMGGPGLFTDQGAAIITAPTPGLAQRLAINPAVDPEQGGETWRLRDGIHAVTPGNIGDSTLVEKMIAALRAPLSNPQTANAAGRSLGDLTASLAGSTSTARVRSDAIRAGRSAHDQALQHSLAAGGVDTDHELERLLAFEQAYAANARVIKAADNMLGTILGI